MVRKTNNRYNELTGKEWLQYSFSLTVLKREDLLVYGEKKDKYMKVAKWDSKRGTIDCFSLVPKI